MQNISENNFDESGIDDLREELTESLADGFATLAEARATPDGFTVAAAEFGSEDVDFASNGWLNRLLSVQGWLNFSEDLPATSVDDCLRALLSELDLASDITMEAFRSSDLLPVEFLQRLRDRVDAAVRVQDQFLTLLSANGGDRGAATQLWVDTWSEVLAEDGVVSAEPVEAKTDVWPIYLLTKKPPNLTPTYQRGDVWKSGDRQALIESILRGVPLPSIILLRTGASTPPEVVDGKQRLTAIFRFVGQHPVARRRLEEFSRRHPTWTSKNGATLVELFEQDYPAFRRAWKHLEGEPLTAKLEDKYYFPFKLRASADGGLVGDELEPLQGKYYTQIKRRVITVAGEEVTIADLFEDAVNYKMPVISYTKATQSQIHEVFRLYNKQGVHLNAEEIRNAVFHELELTRAMLVAAGDSDPEIPIDEIAKSLVPVQKLERLGIALSDYGFGNSRYKRTKVLGWVISALLHDTDGRDLASTARNIDQLLIEIRDNQDHRLRDLKVLSELFTLIVEAAEIHSAHDELWSESFMDGGKGARWQELQLVGSLVGICMALSLDPEGVEETLELKADKIRSVSATDWIRPEKTQTRTQWDYIARIVKDLLGILDLDPHAASVAVRERFGSSGYESLERMIIRSEQR